MQVRIDPKSGNRLSALGFGCMRFPRDTGKTEQLILRAVEAGINYFDTAYVYGNSEVVLGEILHKNALREKLYLATKLPFQKCREHADLERLFQTQLTRLRTDYIDYYLIHNICDLASWQRLCALGIEDWIAAKKASGQIRQIGFSFHGSQDSFFALADAFNWDFCQIQYNYLDEYYQAGRAGLHYAHKKGLPVIIMEPLLGGKLAVGLPQKAVKLFEDAAPRRSPASWALRWLWNQPEVTVVLSGMNGYDQLEDNLTTAGEAAPGMLSERESAVFVPVTEAVREAYKVPCTGCNYCMPCPHGVNIPACFSAYNKSYAMGYASGMMQYLVGMGMTRSGKQRSGASCVKCGACEAKCPQNIPIIQALEATTRRMEPLWARPIFWVIRKVLG